MPQYLCSNSTVHCFTHEGKCIPLPCGQWSCPECRRILAFQWSLRARLGVGETIAYMWTFTQPSKVHSLRFAYEILPSQWKNVRQKCQRAWGTWLYLAVVEGQPHRYEMPHFHVLSFNEMPQRPH